MDRIIYKIISSLSDLSEDITKNDMVKKLNSLFKGEELHSLTKSLRDYRKESRGKIQREHSNLFHQILLLIEVYQDIIGIVGENWHKSPSSFQDDTKYKIYAVSSLFNKSSQTVLDMLSLLESGSLVPTLVLWRIIYENYIISRYLLDNTDDMSERFNDHWLITENRIRKGGNEAIASKIASLIEKYGPRYQDNYGWAGSKKNEKGRFNSFAAIHNQMKSKEFFEMYSFTSDIINSSSYSVNRSIFSDGRYGNTDMIGTFFDDFRLPIEWTLQVMEKFVGIILEYFYFEDPYEKKSLCQIIEVLSLSIIAESGRK